MGKYSQTPLTPSSVNKYIKSILEKDINLEKLYITGEVSNVKYHSNGNIYFNIKDNEAQINCIMFKNYQMKMDFKIVEGDKVELLGNLYTYVKMGQYNINVFKIRKTGQGDLYQKYLELKKELESLGYFNQNHKKEIPLYPKVIGVLTSDTGAAIRDIITTIKRRYPIAQIKIIPTLVQGKNAYTDIVKNIKKSEEYDFDVIILGRGGGSIEDLWSFNEREVANAIYDCKIPIISAVGHETDFTIADFVADKRAATPTAAAEIATPNMIELKENLNKNINSINNSLNNLIKINKERLNLINQNQYFQNPLLNIQTDFMFLNEKFLYLVDSFKVSIETKRNLIDNLSKSNVKNIEDLIEKNKNKIVHQKENLDNLNPLNILSKGYSVVKKENEYIKTINDLKVGDDLNIKLVDGELTTSVIEIKGE